MQPTDLQHAIESAQQICAELASGVVAGPSGSEYRQDAIYDLANATRAMADALTHPHLEIVTYRDPDGDTALRLFANGTEIDYVWCDIDPGRGYSLDAWHDSCDWHASHVTPAAAEAVRQFYEHGATTPDVT